MSPATTLRVGAAAAVLAATSLLGWSTPAAAVGCTGGDGVTVVVDFGPYGEVQTGCATDPTNGLSVLSQAGFGVVQVTGQPGFVCRIDGVPPVEDDACQRTPPTTAYWSYWQAPPGSTSWTYSSQGAASTSPADGATEGWAFGSGAPPGLSPPPNTAPPPPPPPPSSPPATTSSGAPPPPPSPSGSAGTPAPSTTDPSGRPAPPTTTSGTTTTPTTSGTATTTPVTDPTTVEPTTTDDVRTEADSPSGPVEEEGGSSWALLATGVLAAALAGGAFWQVRRRS